MNNHNFITMDLSQHGSSLGPRDLGAEIRENILSLLKNKDAKILISFKGVHIISSAFADEVFGKLFVELGEEKFKSTIKINGFDTEEERVITLSIINKGIAFRRTIKEDSRNNST